MHSLLRILVLTLFVGTFSTSFAQNISSSIQKHLVSEQENLGLTDFDLNNWSISAQHKSAQSGYNHIYIVQTYEGIEITKAVASLTEHNGTAQITGNRLVSDIASRINTSVPSITEAEAINYAASALGLATTNDLKEIERRDKFTLVFQAPALSMEDIPVKLVYTLNNAGELKLSWELNIYEASLDHWWNVQIDAITGELIYKIDWVVSCTYGDHDHSVGQVCTAKEVEQTAMMPAPPPGTDQYNVFAIPVESPSHGSRSLVVGPYDAAASPFGWHDDDGVAGPEYTITRGNNVRATEDINDNNGTGYFPDGGAALDFNFPLNMNQTASNYLDPAITNLFYMNNIMHDVWYHYGFDEVSGNFQQNNYGNGGSGSDYVRAEAQDGGGTNNANFATPNDGSNPRMQMYLWSPSAALTNLVTVNGSGPLAGAYQGAESSFGPPIPATPITADLVLYNDGNGITSDACQDPLVPADYVGKIALIRRGSCQYTDKVQRAQDAGAVAVIVVNNTTGLPLSMTGLSTTITIPSLMVSNIDGDNFTAALTAGDTINVSINASGSFELDGDFDNGIIAHEYGHGISNRLTGGPSNSGCLGNEEQMGEGWSDWFGLMLTIEPGDASADVRGIGTFASGVGPLANGIRPAPYSTDLAVNNFTYGATNNSGISQPHGIGFVWCTMLWDMNWALIDEYGYDSDVYTGSGGNNIAMNLVTNALKLQPCGPGFVDGRDAILAADVALYGGIHECLIWQVFANRGLGYSADQGDADDRFDQVEAFDMPPALVSQTTVSQCGDYVWALNGQTYSATGIYTAPFNGGIGCTDSAVLDLTIIAGLNAGVIVNGSILAASQPGLNYQWVDCDNNYTPIAGATNQFFSPTVNGNYAVVVSGSGCSDTSVCNIILVTNSIVENDFGNSLQLYPNPTDGNVTVSLGANEQGVRVVLRDLTGRELSSSSFNEVESFDIEIEGSAGIYFVEITTENGKKAQLKVQKNK